jgi:cytochrome c oxidase cbb3-type subunit 4
MDINDVRSAITVICFVIFLGIIAWAWSKRNKKDFDEAANLPFQDEQ